MPLPRPAIGFVPTPDDAIAAMVQLADLTAGDRVYDLGCGDGRLLIHAARGCAIEGVGLDVDGALLAAAQKQAAAAGVGDRLRFHQADLFAADLTDADVVFIYLLPHLNLRLRPRLRSQLRSGSRIVTHMFAMGDWPPSRRHVLPRSEEDSVVYLWRIP